MLKSAKHEQLLYVCCAPSAQELIRVLSEKEQDMVCPNMMDTWIHVDTHEICGSFWGDDDKPWVSLFSDKAMFSVDASGGFGAECADFNTINMGFLKVKETPKSDGSSSSLAWKSQVVHPVFRHNPCVPWSKHVFPQTGTAINCPPILVFEVPFCGIFFPFCGCFTALWDGWPYSIFVTWTTWPSCSESVLCQDTLITWVMPWCSPQISFFGGGQSRCYFPFDNTVLNIELELSFDNTVNLFQHRNICKLNRLASMFSFKWA